MSESLVTDAVEDALGHLEGLYRENVNWLNEEIDDSETVFTLLDAPTSTLQAGSIMAIGYTEMVTVRSVSGSDVTVVRGRRGTSPVEHATGDLVEISPRFGRPKAMQRLRNEIRSWPAGVHGLDVVTITASSGVQGYEVDPTNVLRIVRIEVGPGSGDSSSLFRQVGWRWDPEANRTSFPLGGAIYLPDFGEARTVKVVLAKQFDLDVWGEDIDLVDDVGLAESMVDLAGIGTAYRLLQEGPRTQTQALGASSDGQTVAPGQITSVRQDLERWRKQRIKEEQDRIKDLYLPIESAW